MYRKGFRLSIFLWFYLISFDGFWLLLAVCFHSRFRDYNAHHSLSHSTSHSVIPAKTFTAGACSTHLTNSTIYWQSISRLSGRGHYLGGLMSSVSKTFVPFIVPVFICLSKAVKLVPATPSWLLAGREVNPLLKITLFLFVSCVCSL